MSSKKVTNTAKRRNECIARCNVSDTEFSSDKEADQGSREGIKSTTRKRWTAKEKSIPQTIFTQASVNAHVVRIEEQNPLHIDLGGKGISEGYHSDTYRSTYEVEEASSEKLLPEENLFVNHAFLNMNKNLQNPYYEGPTQD